MTGRIFRAVALTAALAVLLAAALTAAALFNVYEDSVAAELRTEAEYIRHALAQQADELAFFEDFEPRGRVTLIAPDGSVLYESSADSSGMDNHLGRPEVEQAFRNGWGGSERRSDTLSEVTIYCAVRTGAGNVLRLSSTRSSMLGVFLRALPPLIGILLAVALLSMLVARMAALRIVAPVNGLNLDAPLENEVYDELSPLLTRMDRQRREIERQMRQLDDARRELAAITRNMREGLVVLDREGGVLSMNESAARIFGADAEAGDDLLSLSRDPGLRESVAKAQSGEAADAILERDGCAYQLLASPVKRDGSVAGVVLLILDVTEKIAAERSRREFTANVSHELKTPLTSISGYAELIRDGLAKPADVPGFAGRICDEAKRLLALIEDILALSRLDERQGIGERERVDLREAAREVAERLEPLAEEKGIELTFAGEAAGIEAYPRLLGEMLYNLIDNAIKYTGEGGRVDVRVEKGPEGAAFAVSDTGVGIPKEHQGRVFERFYRVDKSHSRATGGTGLGLSIVKHGAMIHGARIALESEPGKGTRIELTF